MNRIICKQSRIVVGTFGFMLIGAVTALACIWSLYTDHSVRFNSFRSGRGFYRLPPLPIMYDSKTGKEFTVNERNESGDSEVEWETGGKPKAVEPLAASPNEIWEQVRSTIQQENLSKAKLLLQSFLTMTAQPMMEEDDDWQQRRNSAYDLLDALTAWQQGSKIKSVHAYLMARLALDEAVSDFAAAGANSPGNPEENEHWKHTQNLIQEASADRNLQDNWSYLQGALLYHARLQDSAFKAFQEHITKYPRSEKNEAAMYMAAKLTMIFSHSFENTGCGITDTDEWGNVIDPAKIVPTEKCQDENWHSAVKAFQEVMRKYPNGRYFNDARGWLAYLYRRGGERARSLAEYYRLLGHPTDWNARLEAKKSLQMIGHKYDDATLNQVETLIADDANAALAYAYHRIYNHAVDYTYQEANGWAFYGENERWDKKREEEKHVAEAHQTGNHELSRVARFATAMMRRHPKATISSSFVLRVAQAQFELQNYAEALRLSGKALAMGIQGDARAQTLWIKGSAEHQQKHYATARATFNQLIAAFPKSNLIEGARRLLAMTAEDQGDFETALEQYLTLRYDYDVAYFVDVLLATDQLAKFVANHQQVAQYNELLYALGIRYLRDKRWNEARTTLQQVQAKPGPRSEDWQIAGTPPRRSFDKDPDWEWRENPYLKMSWVMQDLKTIDVLERLEQAVENAQGDETKAEAMYQLASYQFDADSLLFYNPVAWRGQRYWLLSDLDGSDLMRLPNESQMIFNYSQSHETLARAIPIYLEIVDRFPQTKAAKDALYTAAVAHQHLSNLNPYWRSIYGQGLFVGSRLVTYADVRRTYPNYQLPRGTNGWEASTRTVNGGPGWSPPPPKPKPVPKPTRAQRIKRMLKRVVAELHTSLQQKVDAIENRYTTLLQRCLNVICWAIGLMGAWYAAILGLHIWKQRLTVPEPDLVGLFAADVPPDNLPDSESRVEKVIGNNS
ncbi:MAG TPA: outer membrane protein assembly factor BamD [Blastocatellia bacterium]|nr:outer membrane protein assembly factor BamD [Blastocatellia bacterium]